MAGGPLAGMPGLDTWSGYVGGINTARAICGAIEVR